MKKSTVSRSFVRASQKDLDDINHADLSQHRFVGLVIDGIEFIGRSVVAAMGITDDLKKVRLGIREGDKENSEVVKDLLASILERRFELRRQEIFVVIDGSKALKKGLVAVFG